MFSVPGSCITTANEPRPTALMVHANPQDFLLFLFLFLLHVFSSFFWHRYYLQENVFNNQMLHQLVLYCRICFGIFFPSESWWIESVLLEKKEKKTIYCCYSLFLALWIIFVEIRYRRGTGLRCRKYGIFLLQCSY